MVEPAGQADREWLCEQVKKYSGLRPLYVEYSKVLRQVLEKAASQVAPLAIVQARAKTMPSFAEKAWRKRFKYRDPLRRMTDLCGARVITQTQADVKAVCDFIKAHLAIDQENSLDVSQRLKPTEFGYRSVHYIVQFRPDVFPSKHVDVIIPDIVFPTLDSLMKSEIQVRTVVEHAWAGYTHDKAYKAAFTIPDKWQRELAGLAAMLEEADRSFSRIQEGLQTYAANYGAYMSEEQMRSDMEMWETVLACDPQNLEVAYRLGKLAMTLGEWEKAIGVFSPHVESGYKPILRDLGVAICKVHAQEPKSVRYREGQRYLEVASAPPHEDADALASLAGTWKGVDERKVRELYRLAFDTDPSDPYVVSNYLVYEIAYRRDTSLVALMRPTIVEALQRCRDQADVGMNLPWAFFNLGVFHLLLGEPNEALAAYAKAIELSTNDWMVDTSLRLLDKLTVVRDALPGHDWARRLLVLAWAFKFPTPTLREQIKALASTGHGPIAGPVVLVAGGCDVSVQERMEGYREFLLQGFRDFRGTVICGGTTSGISGIVGEVQAAYPEAIQTIGYVPQLIPAGIVMDARYRQIRRTEGQGFSPVEALQYWIDLIASGIPPDQVKLVGVNGGDICASEYRLALAFGARVAVIEGSGRAVTQLLSDPDWAHSPALIRLPADEMSMRAFVGSGSPKLEAEIRGALARAIHEAYRDTQAVHERSEDPALAEWEELRAVLKESNCQQADHIVEKLRQIGRTMHTVEAREVNLATFSPGEIEMMAQMEHGRWVAERLAQGWTFGEKRDVGGKKNPYLVPWSALPEQAKEMNRETVRGIPGFLARVGLEIGPKG